MKTNRHAAFTLMELMISIALALILILGINEVFGLTSKAVGAGQALSSAYQADRGTQIVMARDFSNEVNTAPFIITSQYQTAFRSQMDQADNQSTNPAIYNPIGQNITYPPNSLSLRVKRLDTVAFCARDLFQRQTGGGGGAFITPGTSYEAYIWYGHLNVGNTTMPNTSTGWSPATNPGVGMPASGTAPPPSNPNDYYSSQWVLGRMAMLFQQTTSVAYNTGVEYGAKSSDSQFTVQTSGYDVVSGLNEGTIDKFTSYIYSFGGGATGSWWGGTSSSNISNPAWLNYRFQCEPMPPRPLTTSAAAFLVPAFVTGCSQFCVEFAGDYVSQNVDGSVNTSGPPGPDGTIDFNVVNGVHQIRWYGMPRNVTTGDGTISFARGDVVRVQDVPGIPPNGAPAGTPQPYTFEKMPTSNSTNSSNQPNPTTYIAAWHPLETNNPRPKLIRITWAVDDPNNRLGAPVSFEYVFPVP